MGWYRWASETYPEGMVLQLSPGVYRCSQPLVFDRGNVTIRGAGRLTRIVGSVKWGTPTQRTWLADIESLQIVSPEFFTRGNDLMSNDPAIRNATWSSFTGVGLEAFWAGATNFRDLRITGFAVGLRAHVGTSRSVFEDVRVEYCTRVGFHFAGSPAPSANGNAWLVDCRLRSCEVTSNYDFGMLTEYGYLYDGACAGDQFLHMCGALHCIIGLKIAEPPASVPVGYRLNWNVVQSFFDYCRDACIDARGKAGELSVVASFLGVTGMTAVQIDRLKVALCTIGALPEPGGPVRSGVYLTECRDALVLGNTLKEFGIPIRDTRGRNNHHESNQITSMNDNDPTTVRGVGIKVEGGSGHVVTSNRVDPKQQVAALIQVDGAAKVTTTSNVDHLGNPILVASQPPI